MPTRDPSRSFLTSAPRHQDVQRPATSTRQGTGARDPRAESREARFDALVRAHYGQLCNFVYRYVASRATAEDIVQELLARIWERPDLLDDGDPLPYLYRAARNNALMHLRHDRVHARWRAKLVARSEPPEAVMPQTDLDELSRAIAAAVAALPERCRLIFTMHREQDLRYTDIARVLGISVKTVETQMARAMRSLRNSLAPYLPSAVIALVAGLPQRFLG